MIKSKHARFIKYCLNYLPEQYAYLETSKLLITFFSLTSLDNLNEPLEDDLRNTCILWIQRLEIKLDMKGLKCMGYSGSTFFYDKKPDSVPDAFSKFGICQTYPHITMTLSAILIYKILNLEIEDCDKVEILQGLTLLQNKDGSFNVNFICNESDMRFVYCACAICYLFDDWTFINVEMCKKYIYSCYTYEGGFSHVPGAEAHGGSTFCAIASLKMMGNFDVLNNHQMEQLIYWCVVRQHTYPHIPRESASGDRVINTLFKDQKDDTYLYGFNGRPNKDMDTCYSFWIGASLDMLGCLHLINSEKHAQFLTCMQDYLKGGIRKAEDVSSDPLHTFLGLTALTMYTDLKDSNGKFHQQSQICAPLMIRAKYLQRKP